MKKSLRIGLIAVTGVVALIVVALIAGAITSQTEWFKNKIRERIVTEVEGATGGRVEIGRFNYDWKALTAEVSQFTLHGKETAGTRPLFKAAKIQVGLKIISVFEKKVDLASVVIDAPELHIVIAPDGTTNFPTPKRVSRNRGVIAQVLNLKIRSLVARNGVAEYNSERVPIDFRADQLTAGLKYFPGPPRYAGEITSHQLHISSADIHDAAFDLDSHLALLDNRLAIEDAVLKDGRSIIRASGSLSDLSAAHGTFGITARLQLDDAGKWIKLPVERRGELSYSGKADIAFQPFRYSLTGKVQGRELAFSSKQLKLNNFALASNITIAPNRIVLPNVDVSALSGHFRGSAEIIDNRRFRVRGTADSLSVQQLAAAQGEPRSELNGALSGAVEADGLLTRHGPEQVTLNAKLNVRPGPTGIPVEGSLDINYEQRAGVLRLGNSGLTLGSSHIAVSGTLGQTVAVHINSANLDDFVSALPLIGEERPKELPVKLVNGGTARFDGTVSGTTQDAVISGQVQLTNFAADGRTFRDLSGAIELTRSGLNVKTAALDGEAESLTGSGEIGLADWKLVDASQIRASVVLRRGDIHKLLEESGNKLPVSGTATASATIAGTYGAPRISAHVQANNVIAYDEPVRHVEADVNLSRATLEIQNGRATAQPGTVEFSGAYQHPRTEWTSGQARFNVRGTLMLAQVQNIRSRREGIEGRADLQATGMAHVVKGDIGLDSLNGQIAVRDAVIDGQPLGNMTASATTRGQVLDVRAVADLRGTEVHGSGEWQLTGDYQGNGQISVPRLTLATIRDLIPSKKPQELPFTGFLSADIHVSGPLKKPENMRADVTIPVLQINARPNVQPRAGAQAKDLVLRNAGPILVGLSTKGADLKSAHLAGTDTTLQAAGHIAFTEKSPWDLTVNGSINLAVLQLFNPDLLGSGISTVSATVRGGLSQPDVNGRLELKNASLYLTDVPNGLDKANGVIIFDRSRATIQELAAETGGGKISFQRGSFVGFGTQTLTYHVQATADHVRYRSPEGVSITVNANLSLAGTSDSSILSGSASVMRAGFTPHTDIGSLLASTAKPIAVPATPNAYFRGMQFDIRVESAQTLEIVTSLTRDIEAEANLRIRGNIEHPAVLGNISVTEGEIDFFGNKYTINRGEVNFFNPAKVEPIIDMDLETRVRGITVDITFSGPLNKLNFSYRSDPPLETNQIIALLAVGREPVGVGALASTQTSTNSSYMATGSNALLAQAITAPVAGRLQRFFGVSHIKIDPQLADLTSVPQARLTLEQQISKDITLTYITNLARTSEQIIRVEWDLNRQWSVVALRDENGAFGVDFQYRKRFK